MIDRWRWPQIIVANAFLFEKEHKLQRGTTNSVTHFTTRMHDKLAKRWNANGGLVETIRLNGIWFDGVTGETDRFGIGHNGARFENAVAFHHKVVEHVRHLLVRDHDCLGNEE